MIKKNGTVLIKSINESDGQNRLINAEKYISSNPWILSGAKSDNYIATDMYTQVTPGQTYFFSCETDAEWSDGHGYNESRKGKVTIWLYLLNEYNPSNTWYDKPVNFHANSSNKVKTGLWKYAIPDGYNMARVRFNTYSDGEEVVTCKFWDVKLIPEKYYVTTPPQENLPSMHIGEEYISVGEIIEV